VDGCLISGTRVLPGASDLIRRFGHKLALVTNNSTDTAQSLALRLSDLGLHPDPARIFAAGEVAVRQLGAEHRGARVFVLGNETIRRACREHGLILGEDMPDFVLVCRDTELTFERLEQAIIWAHRGVPIVLANRDISHPGAQGPAVETGALYQLISSMTTPVLWREIGKPEPALIESALDGTDPATAVFIGDNPDTDQAGADKAGIPCLLIGPGPHAVAKDIAGLLLAL